MTAKNFLQHFCIHAVCAGANICFPVIGLLFEIMHCRYLVMPWWAEPRRHTVVVMCVCMCV